MIFRKFNIFYWFFFFTLSLNEFSFWLHMLHWEILQNACSDRIFFNMSYYMLLWVSTEKTYFNSHFRALSWEGELPSSFKVIGFDGWRTQTEIPVSFQIEKKTEKKINLSQLSRNEAKGMWPFNHSFKVELLNYFSSSLWLHTKGNLHIT